MSIWKDPVRAVVQTRNVSLTACPVAQDNVTLVQGDRVLVVNQLTTPAENGIYDVGVVSAGVAPLTRSFDANTSALMAAGATTRVTDGSIITGGVVGATSGFSVGKAWQLVTPDPITLGTTPLYFAATNPIVNVRDFGAKGDNTTDDTNAFLNAIAALWRGGTPDPFLGFFTARTLFIPAGMYLIHESLTFLGSLGLTIMGEGRQATLLIWRGCASSGPGSQPFFHINSSQLVTVKDLSVWGHNSAPPSEIFYFDYNPVVFASTQFLFQNVQLSGQSGVEEYEIGLRFNGQFGNNDLHVFVNCLIDSYKETGVSMEGSQQKGFLFLGCNLNGSWDGVEGHAGGKSAIDTSRGSGAMAGQGGSFTFIGGSVGHNRVAAFILGAPNDPIVIEDVNGEANFRFVDNDVAGAGPNGSGVRQIAVRGCRDDVSAIADYAPDRIRLQGPGPHTIEGNEFRGVSSSLPYILLEIVNGSASVKRNLFITPGSFRKAAVVVNGQGPVGQIDCAENVFLDDLSGVANQMEWLRADADPTIYTPVSGVALYRPDFIAHQGKPGIQVTFSAFTAAALSQTVKIWDLPRGARVKSMYMLQYQPFTGTGLATCHIRIGSTIPVAGLGGDEYLLDTSGTASNVLIGGNTSHLGTNFTGPTWSQGAHIVDYFSGGSLYATITNTGTCNVNAFTNGYFFLWLEIDVLQRFVFSV